MSGGGVVMTVVYLAIVVVLIASLWKIFVKAGQPGWACLVPIYNIIVYLGIAGKPWWWLLLMLIPIVNFVIAILVAVALAEKFGKGAGFAVGLVLLAFVFYPILGFGEAQYQG
jgi:uncharacterized membrane protein YoaK (UPF0700 family)